MRLNIPMGKPVPVLSLSLILLLTAPLLAAVDVLPRAPVQWHPVQAGPVLLVENGKGDDAGPVPAPGTLVIPGEDRDSGENRGDRKCMTVCARWGEECQYIDRGAGGQSKKCRRTCKQFTEECFK